LNYTVLTSYAGKFLKWVSLKQVFHASLCLECLQWEKERGGGTLLLFIYSWL